MLENYFEKEKIFFVIMKINFLKKGKCAFAFLWKEEKFSSGSHRDEICLTEWNWEPPIEV